jgi:hypothetical protein
MLLQIIASSPAPMSFQTLSDTLGIGDSRAWTFLRDIEARELVSLSGDRLSITAKGKEFLETSKKRYAGPGPIIRRLPDAVNGVPIRRIGYWEGPSEPGWPKVEDFVDHDWAEMERDIVASYLEDAFIPWVECGISMCRFCGKPNGSAERSDGVYMWPEGLPHYVREHGVRLPVSVIRHIVGRTLEMHPERVDSSWWRTATLDS